jgi:hypothetical protein
MVAESLQVGGAIEHGFPLHSGLWREEPEFDFPGHRVTPVLDAGAIRLAAAARRRLFRENAGRGEARRPFLFRMAAARGQRSRLMSECAGAEIRLRRGVRSNS